jgi:hypothetical protein
MTKWYLASPHVSRIIRAKPPCLDFFTSYNCKCKVKKVGKIGMEFGREMEKGLAIIG